ncbi:MAG: hypothetical protein NZO16_02895 [Deltaproteobacteria bacterium]|nr:hypothetical protein [Deltaproteobacteria bacterium]
MEELLELSSKGFVLLETFSAGLILSITILFATVGLVNGSKMISKSRLSSMGAIAASTVLEQLRQQTMSQINSGNQMVSVGDKIFSVNVQICPTGTVCSSDTKSVLLKVHLDSALVYEVSTVLTNLR